MDRRGFLLRVVAGVGAVGLGAWWVVDRVRGPGSLQISELRQVGVRQAPPAAGSVGAVRMPARYAENLGAMVERLLPAGEDAAAQPGARELGVWSYIQRELADPSIEHTLRLVMRGAAQLDRVAVSEVGAPFGSCTPEQRDRVILAMQGGAGANDLFDPVLFVETMISLTLEGALADPMHGGNAGGAGWAWIGYAMHPPRPGGGHGH